MPLEGGTVQNDASNFPSHSAVARGMSNSDRNPGQVIDVNSVHHDSSSATTSTCIGTSSTRSIVVVAVEVVAVSSS